MRSNEPMFADETVVTRADRDKLPTMEIPFPEAEHGTTMESAQPLDTNPAPGNARQAVPSSASEAGASVRKRRRTPIWKPLLTTRIHPIVFIAIPCILLAILGIAMLVMQREKSEGAGGRYTRRGEGGEGTASCAKKANRLLHEGRVNDAYDALRGAC